ncbi:MAG TPA: peptidoglycan-binding domain-containing protein [Acidimicrobiia bacterium]|nr:peptidoglycan-binding domain-containing protein [Acidimicrobiia bacterium]
MEQWFQNTRGLVIIVLAVITGAVLLAIEPGDGFPTGTSSANGGGTTVTTTVTTLPPVTTTTTAHQTIQEGTPNTSETTTLQQRLNALGFDVGAPDGSFGPTTTAQVKAFQTANKLPATGVVDAATWNALLATPATSTPTTTTTTKP